MLGVRKQSEECRLGEPPHGGMLGVKKQSEECRLGEPPRGGMLGVRKQSEECRVGEARFLTKLSLWQLKWPLVTHLALNWQLGFTLVKNLMCQL